MRVVYFVLRYPTVSQTFIEREMTALAALGWRVEVHPIFDFRPPTKLPPSPPGLTVVRAGPLWRVLPLMTLGTLRELARRPALLGWGLQLLFGHFPRHAEGWFMTLWGTLFALGRAHGFRRREPARRVDVFHGAWATAPATAAAVLGELCGRPFSFGAHAYDLHRHGGDPLLAPKLRAARFVHTTTQANADALRTRFPDRRADIVLARRGLGREWFERAGQRSAPRSPDGVLRLLSVGRLVEKKGHAHQLAACAELARRGRSFRLRIIGEGPLRTALEAQIAAARLGENVALEGERPPAQVEEAYRWTDAFWHTGVVDAQGDRDGLPNVVPEAMAHRLPVISSRAGGAAEAITDGENGLLVADPADAAALADAVAHLADDLELRARLGAAGRAWVETNFLSETNIRRLAVAFTSAATG